MEMNFITPLQSMTGNTVNSVSGKDERQGVLFQEVFEGALKAAGDADKITKDNSLQVAMGNTDELHKVTLASTQAELSLKLFVQIRNKAHEAYSEVMRMGI